MNTECQMTNSAAALSRIEACRRGGKAGLILDLRDLGLTQLPPEIVQLTALAELSLIENQFTRLPLALLNLTHLKALFQHGNPGLKLSLTFLGE